MFFERILLLAVCLLSYVFFFFQAEDGIRDKLVTGVQTCALPISRGVWPRGGGGARAASPSGGGRAMKLYLRLLHFLRPYWVRLIAAAVCSGLLADRKSTRLNSSH